jgi:cytochrome c oxidase assembly factor CtaG
MRKLTALAGAMLALLGVSLLWSVADQLFSAHMAQHLLLIAVAAPLLVLGGVEIRVPPLAGWGLFVSVFVFWHWPAAFQWAAASLLSQLFELATIFAAAICFWSGILGSSRLNDGARALMLMTAAILTDLPGVVMLFAPTAICVMPAEDASRFGLTPLSDQQLAGLLMWVPANLVFFGVATFLFARWISSNQHHPMVLS